MTATIRKIMLAGFLILLWVAFAWQTQAGTGLEEDFEFWPGASYSADIPTLEQVAGHVNGDRVTWPHHVVEYFYALQAAAPDRIKVWEYARTWEGRPLVYAVIGSAANIARLDTIEAGIAQLADPRSTSSRDADDLIRTLPGTVWLSYGVHGNEISSSDAAIMTAYHLLAVEGDDRIDAILENTLVFINPMQNPDGRARFVHNFEIAEGMVPDSDQISAERAEPWPGGRTNHYLFDLNRDWLVQSQPETAGHIAALLRWRPLAFVDAHEMGSDSSYFFGPEAVPFNPHLADDQMSNLELFGRNNARWFDRFGFDYFTREVFDAFYPGYGASWPSYFGSIAMTYEQASSRGLMARRSDGTEFHYRETVRHHFVTSLSTAEVVSNNREMLLRDFYDYGVTAIEEGRTESNRAYVIPAQADQTAADRLAGLLSRQGVEVFRATNEFRSGGTTYGAGSYAVNLAQPSKRLIRVLLDNDVPMDDEFLTEQERRRTKDMGDQIYDVTAWSLPLMFNVDVVTQDRAIAIGGGFEAVEGELVVPATVDNNSPGVAYLVPWGTTAAGRVLTAGLRAGFVIKSSDLAFTLDAREYPAGTLIFKVDENPAGIADWMANMADETGAEIVGINDSWVTLGPSLGSGNVVSMVAPKVAIAWDSGSSSYAAGNTRFVIERQLGYPVTAIRTSFLSFADLSRYQVLILPPESFFGGSYAGILGPGGVENLKRWVRSGGTLIAMGTAMRFITSPDVDLLSVRREQAAESQEDESGEDSATVPGSIIESVDQYRDAIAITEDSPDSVAGVLVRADVDADHWLGAGVAESLNVLVRGGDIYTPMRMDDGVNVARFVGADELLASGYIWEENRLQLAYKPFVVEQDQGRGVVIGFTQDPTVRAYLDGLNVLILNAIFRGSAHANPVR
jgi:Zinc carboxypeptidase